MKQIVSDLMLERYNLGEVTGDEKQIIEILLTNPVNTILQKRLDKLHVSDKQIRSWYTDKQKSDNGRSARRYVKVYKRTFVKALACAAALAVIVMFPIFRMQKNITGNTAGAISSDRIKGSAAGVRGGMSNIAASFKLYVKDSNNVIEQSEALYEGDTIQLAYTVNINSGSPVYGVIFSVDGRAVVTQHFPYSANGDSVLTGGREVLLSEAYTLDDAPIREVFFLLISDNVIDVNTILEKANSFAGNLSGIEANIIKAFPDYIVKTISVIKG